VILDLGTFATNNSVHLGRFRVKNATVRAGKRVHYGLRLYTRLFGVGNATVWGYFCDCWRFVIERVIERVDGLIFTVYGSGFHFFDA